MNPENVAIAGASASVVYLLFFTIIFIMIYWALGVGFKGATRFILAACVSMLTIMGMLQEFGSPSAVGPAYVEVGVPGNAEIVRETTAESVASEKESDSGRSGIYVLLIPYAGMGFALLATLIFWICYTLWQPFRRLLPERARIKQRAERAWPADGPRTRKLLNALQAIGRLLRFLARIIWLFLLWLWPRVKRGVERAISRWHERRARNRG